MKTRVSAAVLAGLLICSPVHAQLASGYSGQSSAPISGVPDDYWLLLRQVGPCVARSKEDGARAFLAAAPGSDEETRAFDRLFGRNSNVCMQNFVRASFVRSHMRGAVAEGLYERLPVPAQSQPAEDALNAEAVRTLHDFARCYVARQPGHARDLLAQTHLGSQEEADAVIRMSPGFKPCFPKGRKVSVDATEVRMALAEALYHSASTLPGKADPDA